MRLNDIISQFVSSNRLRELTPDGKTGKDCGMCYGEAVSWCLWKSPNNKQFLKCIGFVQNVVCFSEAVDFVSILFEWFIGT